MTDIIILGVIALFILGRLYVALGRDSGPPKGQTRTRFTRPVGEPDKTTGMRQPGASAQPASVRPVPRSAFTGPAAAGLEEIAAVEPGFDPGEFLNGAKAAYEIIVNAFAAGEKEPLRPLLDDEIYESWAAAIDARAETGETVPTLLRIKTAEIEEADMAEGVATVDVLFRAEVGEGDMIKTSRQLWTFERELGNPDPAWKLAAVSLPD